MKLEASDVLAMDDGQKVAVLETLVAGVLADGKVTPDEVRRFDEIVMALPWGMDEPVLSALVKGTQQRVIALKSPADIQDFVASLASRVTSAELRDKLVFTMATVMAADNEVNQLERNVLGLFVLAFGITSERSAAIKAAVQSHRIAVA
ncbi:MAG: TerB family tellurite resistance protein, partial [Kofleriaceae bacterium]